MSESSPRGARSSSQNRDVSDTLLGSDLKMQKSDILKATSPVVEDPRADITLCLPSIPFVILSNISPRNSRNRLEFVQAFCGPVEGSRTRSSHPDTLAELAIHYKTS